MLYKSKSNRNLVKNKDLSLVHLTTLTNFLDNEQNVTQNITKEIKNEINLSKKNEKLIDKSIVKINTDAEELVRRFEEEKQKNEKLEFLVNHIEEEIYKVKLDKASELKNNVQTDKLEEFTNVLKAKEKELEKVCEKTNTSSYELSKKLDNIRALRGERTIVSELLDKIERELCNLEHCYKVLVIERTVEEKLYKEKIEDFNRLESSANKELEKVISMPSQQAQIQREPEELKIVAKMNNESSSLNRSSFAGVATIDQSFNQKLITQQSQYSKDKDKLKEKKMRLENDLLKIECQKKVKIILNDLGLNSVKELPESIEGLDRQNSCLLLQVSQLFEEIETAEKVIGQLTTTQKENKSTNSNKKQYLSKIEQMKKVSESIKSNRLETRQFKEICKILYESVKESLNEEIQAEDFFNEEEEIVFYMGYLQKYFEKSYLEGKSENGRHKKEGCASKRLISLLNNHHFERNHMSIYEEKDLLDFAKKNLEKMEKQSAK